MGLWDRIVNFVTGGTADKMSEALDVADEKITPILQEEAKKVDPIYLLEERRKQEEKELAATKERSANRRSAALQQAKYKSTSRGGTVLTGALGLTEQATTPRKTILGG